MNPIHTEYDIHEYLQRYFHYDSFHEGQKEIITDILNEKDVLGILRTGTGKSLCYQLPAKILPGITLVVSPLISLMIDQVRELQALHFKEAVALHSFQQWPERQRILAQLDTYKLIFVSPELLQNDQVIARIKQQTVSLFVIDEAHCISQWGYDFRPDYLRLPEVIAAFNKPPVLALTGTATPDVQNDIKNKLKCPQMKEHIYPMDRANISLIVEEINGTEEMKIKRLLKYITTYQVPTLVYFSSRLATEKVAQRITQYSPERKVAFYHGGLETTDRLKIQQQFMNNQLDIICCTSAFGMGINKPNIRLIIHYHLPTRTESYIQEIGRAGRDGKESVSVLLYRQADVHIPAHIIENELPTYPELIFILQRLLKYSADTEVLPTDETVIEQQFHIDETKWRYIYFHLEKHDIVKRQRITGTESQLTTALKDIHQISQKRLVQKRQHLNDVILWANTKKCLRMVLYAPFQQAITQKSTNCCSNCGLSLESWQVEEQETVKKLDLDWHQLLKRVLLIGDMN